MVEEKVEEDVFYFLKLLVGGKTQYTGKDSVGGTGLLSPQY